MENVTPPVSPEMSTAAAARAPRPSMNDRLSSFKPERPAAAERPQAPKIEVQDSEIQRQRSLATPKPAGAPPPPKKAQTAIEYLDQYQDQIKMALPRTMSPDRMLRVCMTEIRNSEALRKADPLSLMGAIIQCAQLGLEPGNGLGQVYLIPFKGKVTMVIGYQGLLELIWRSGLVDSVDVQEIFIGDEFTFYKQHGETQFFWEEGPDKQRDQWENYLGTVVTVWLKGANKPMFVRMTREQIELNEATNRKGKDMTDAWMKWPIAMANKTVLRRAIKLLPKSVEMREAYTFQDHRADLRKFAVSEMPSLRSGDEETADASQPEANDATVSETPN